MDSIDLIRRLHEHRVWGNRRLFAEFMLTGVGADPVPDTMLINWARAQR